jgi:DNA-directed RNA polymerase subunit K/omega
MTQNAETAERHDQAAGGETPSEPALPITSRFLFVDVAAQRAKQLRRGALPRLDRQGPSAGPYKLERVAMEEVRTGLIHYTLPSVDFARRAKV